MRHRILTAAVLFLVACTAFAAGNANNAVDQGSATWADHVAPILFENCASCHRPGQTAPMSLLSYDEARPWAKSIAKATQSGEMPPWFADPKHGEFIEDPRLTDEQKETILSWVKAGAPAGDLANQPEPPSFASEWLMGEPDEIFTMEPFEVTDEMEDHYEWLAITNHLDEDRWIKAFEVRPTFMAGAHHNLTYIGPPGMEISDIAGLGRLEMDYVSGWAPGVQPMEYPEGYGKLLPANSTILFQMHYHKTPGPGTGGIDQTAVGLKFYDGEPENKLTTLWVVDPMLNIPPNEANYQSASEHTFEHDAVLFNFTPHMHLRGKQMKFTATWPDGTEEILLDVPAFDFNWQLTYTPIEQLQIPAGTKIAVDAVFDNSSGNEANPDPSITVRWGEETTDEMMIGFMDYAYIDKAKQDDMPTHAVPPAVRKMMEMRKKAMEAEGKSADEIEAELSLDEDGVGE